MNPADLGGPSPPLESSQASESSLDGGFSDRQTRTRKVQTFGVGSLLFGVFEDEVATIAEWRKPTPLPHAPPAILGVVSIQGRMLTVLDSLSLFGETASREGVSHGFIVALRGDEQIALAVADKGEMIEQSSEKLTPPAESTGDLVIGSFSHPGHLVKVLDVRALFPAAIKGSERRRRRF